MESTIKMTITEKAILQPLLISQLQLNCKARSDRRAGRRKKITNFSPGERFFFFFCFYPNSHIWQFPTAGCATAARQLVARASEIMAQTMTKIASGQSSKCSARQRRIRQWSRASQRSLSAPVSLHHPAACRNDKGGRGRGI